MPQQRLEASGVNAASILERGLKLHSQIQPPIHIDDADFWVAPTKDTESKKQAYK